MTNLSQIANFSSTTKKTYNRFAHYFEVTSAKLNVFSCAFRLQEAMEVFNRLPQASLWISNHKGGNLGKRKLLQRKHALAYEL